jgi:hypothetical protein
MPDFTRLEQQLLAQKAKARDAQDAQKRKQARIEAQLKHLHDRRRETRLSQVGRLAEAAGLLWVEDGVLDKLFAELAERVPLVEGTEASKEGE